ncbi:RHS repeat-associated core domain-containing protein [Microbulbifer pacificus]|uniref:RHS repeat-associated core domain-containing protein n=1 Tax=Microbulbifer pacificus TaxID=407164 RepID=UPI001319FC68|nr:RHS repeat-associated core domain-containing protein [Microbulbifer pacificus]
MENQWGNATTRSIDVNVAENQLPIVSLPALPATIDQFETLNLQASASDPDGSIQWVKIFVNTEVAHLTSSPYQYEWTANNAGQYTIYAQAMDNEGGLKTSAQQTVTVNPALPPNPPTQVLIDDLPAPFPVNTTGYYTVSWLEVEGATNGYVLEEREAGVSGDACPEQFDDASDYCAFSVSGLSWLRPNQSHGRYDYRVRACNESGCGDPSTVFPVTVETIVPQAPQNLRASAEHEAYDFTGSYTLRWDAVESFPQPLNYKLEEKIGGLDSGFDWVSLSHSGLETEFDIQNKAPGSYSYRVTACNNKGCNETAEIITVNVLQPIVVDASPGCNKSCLRLAGGGVDPGTLITLTDRRNGNQQTLTGGEIIWTAPVREGAEQDPTTYAQLTLNGAMSEALFAEGVHVAMENANGARAGIDAYGSDTVERISQIDSAPAVGADGTIYVGSGNNVYALNPEDGSIVSGWPFATGDLIKATPVIDSVNGNIYVGSLDDKLYALNPLGLKQWHMTTGGDLLASAVLDENRIIYQGSMDGVLYAVQAQNGAVQWTYPAGAGIAETPVLAGNGTLYFTTVASSQVYALGRGDLGPDQLVWESADDSLLREKLDDENWQPNESQFPQYQTVARLYRLLLQPPLNLSRDVLTFWTYALVKGANPQEVAIAFLQSDTGKVNFPSVQSLTNEGFIDKLYARAFPGLAQPALTYAGQTYTRNGLVDAMTGGMTRAQVAVLFSQSVEYVGATNVSLRRSFDYFYTQDYSWAVFSCDEGDEYTRDCDGDGLPDFWEIQFFGSTDTESGDTDADGDGVSNQEAFLANLDPCANLCSYGVTVKAPDPAPMPTVDTGEIDISGQIGSLPGEFRVSESGAATYQIPLSLPAGTAGVAPQLSINYSSQSGNGLLGHGWALSGLSAITRCRQTLGQDGQARPITWSGEDRFCLDGQRLLVVEGEYGAVGSLYRTEIDSFALIQLRNNQSGMYFTVERKDGSISYFGVTEDAKQTTGQGTLTWAINRFEDSARNRIEFIYQNGGGHKIGEIRYAYENAEGDRDSDYAASVVFEYQNRADAIGGYLAGEYLETTQRLQNILVYNDSTEVRRYELGYKNYPADNLSRLERIRQCVGGLCQSDTLFDWRLPLPGSFSAAASSTVTLSTQADRTAVGTRPADINGDGRMDLVWLEPDWYDDGSGEIAFQTFKYVLAKETGFGTERTVYRESDNTYRPYEWQMIDYNGDGRADLVAYLEDKGYWGLVLSEPDAQGNWSLSGHPQPLSELTERSAKFTDINGDGLVDYLTHNHYRLMKPIGSPGSNRYYGFGQSREAVLDVDWDAVQWNNPMGGEVTMRSARIQSSVAPADFNGDGVVDPIVSLSMYSDCLPTVGGGSCQYTGGMMVMASTGAVGEYANYFYLGSGLGAPDTVDINGDGLPDLVYVRGGNGYYRMNNGAGFEDEVSVGKLAKQRQYFDYDNDGDIDLVWHDKDDARLKVNRWNSHDKKFGTANVFRSTSGGDNQLHLFTDMNGDGVADYVRITSDRASLYPATDFRVPVNVVEKITNGLGAETDIAYGSLTHSGHYTRRDISPTTERRCEYAKYGDTYPAPDDGDYSPWCRDYAVADLADYYGYLNDPWEGSEEYHRLGKLSPTLELMGPMYLVTGVESSAPTSSNVDPDGIQATSKISYFYAQAKIQAGGRGLLGFEELRTVDEQTGVETATTYRQDFPFQGYPVSTVVKTAEGKTLSESVNTWKLKKADGSAWSGWGSVAMEDGSAQLGPLQPWLETSVEKTWALESAVGAEPVKTVTTVNTFDQHGNATDILVTMEAAGDTFVTHTTSTYGQGESLNFANTDHHLSGYTELGRLTKTVVVHERTENGETDTETRTSAFTYHQNGNKAGLLETETIEPDAKDEEGNPAPNLTLTTRYDYDGYGNKILVEQRAGDVAEVRTSRWVYQGNTGRYVEREINAYSQIVSTVTARNELGLPTAVMDIVGNESQIRYDAFGRKVLEYSPTGAHSITLLAAPSSHCPAGSAYQQTVRSAGGGESFTCFDVLARTTRSATRGFDGNWVFADTEYDKLGRVYRKSEPYSGTAGSAQYWTVMSYDILGRVVGTDLPGTVSNNGTGYDVHMAYNGYTTVTTNPEGHTKTEVKNAKGELTLVTDHLGGEISYRYDAQGNLRFVSRTAADSSLNPVTEMRYDLLGRKIWMQDPDKGGWDGKHWEYRYNGFGELVWQQDAKDQQVVNQYDNLGRQTLRIDYDADGNIEGETVWTFNNSAATQDDIPPGALSGVIDLESGYAQIPGYDQLGRQSLLLTSLAEGDDHWTRTTYDQYGRVLQQFDAAGDGTWRSNATENEYNQYGYLVAVQDAENINQASAETYYTVLAMDERGNVTESRQGNGVVTTREYNPATGRLEHQTASILGITQIQDLTYQWDNLGNLDWRKDQSGGKDLFEDFEYDGLNRLKRAQVTGRTAQVLDYDGFGNITHKSDVGDYYYADDNECDQVAGPHALCATVDDMGEATQYSYDANGNMISGGGRSLHYSTFDKPLRIEKDGHTTEFQYGPDRSRYLRVDIDSSNKRTETRYLGNVEKITNPDGSKTLKRYLPGGAVVTITGGERQNRYLHKDHLGSVDVITDASGSVVQAMSFDAWGQRRNAQSWEALIASELTGFNSDITTRGYTGHEMLDQVGLIHMNGRIYDARLGRFLQADPFVQAASDTQMYNRYSYVRNNPLNATDPSGYFIFTLAAAVYLAANTVTWYVAGLIMGVAGFLDALSQGASFKDALKAGFIQGVSAAAFAGIGQASGNYFGLDFGSVPIKVAASGVVGGITSVLQGGKFGHGFVSAGIGAAVGASKGLKLQSGGGWANAGRAAVRITIAGTVSRATGGKFGNAAAYAAFAVAVEASSLGGSQGTTDGPESKVLGDTSNSGESTEIYDGKVRVSKWGSDDATLSKAELEAVKASLNDIFTNGGEGGKALYDALSAEKPLDIYVNDIGENFGQLNGFKLTVDINNKIEFLDQNTQKIVNMSLSRKLAHEMGHSVFGYKDIGMPMEIFGRTKYTYPVVRFTDGIMSGINGTVRGTYCNPYFEGCSQ